MIRIDHIEPFDRNAGDDPIPIDAIRQEFLSRLHQPHRPSIYSILRNAITRGTLYNYKLEQDPINMLQYLIDNYNEILIGDVNTLDRIKTEITNKNWQQLVFEKKTTPFGKKLITAFGYTNRFRSDQERGIWLAKKLNIKSCPYCNAQYTLYIENENTNRKALFQFDHFFHKSRYPYFSVSLYNLIPSCASCNHSKPNTDVSLTANYHPYYHSLASLAKFHLEYPSEIDKLSFDTIRNMNYEEELNISFVHKYSDVKFFVEKHDFDFHITSIYQRHKDHAHELLLKSVMNDKHYQDAIRGIEGLFLDKATLMKYLLSNYLEENEMLKRPLAKLYQDLAKQLGLI